MLVTFSDPRPVGLDSVGASVCAGARFICVIQICCCKARAFGMRESGCSGFTCLLPNLKPVLYAQFWISIPVIHFERSQPGNLRSGVAEPMPSWGSLLKELEGMVSVG